MPAKKADKPAPKKETKKSKAAAETEEVIEVATEESDASIREVPEIDSKYRLILLAAQRSKQLQKGATVRVNEDPRKHKHTFIALKEVRAMKVNFEFTEEE